MEIQLVDAGVELTAAGVDAILDEAVEGSFTLRQVLRLLAALAAKVSGGGTATLVFRDLNDTKPRITMTVDADGNRTASSSMRADGPADGRRVALQGLA